MPLMTAQYKCPLELIQGGTNPVSQNDNCIIWNGISPTAGEETPTETRRR